MIKSRADQACTAGRVHLWVDLARCRRCALCHAIALPTRSCNACGVSAATSPCARTACPAAPRPTVAPAGARGALA